MRSEFDRKTVLVISSDDRLEKMLKESFRDNRIERIPDGRMALEQILSVEPDLVMIEYDLQGLDGRSVFQRFVQDRHFTALHRIPFILFSSEEDVRTRHGKELFDLGLSGWYVHPVGLHELRDIVKNHFMGLDVFLKNRELKQKVKTSEFRYRDLLENAVDFIFTLDGAGRFVYLNNRFNSLVHNSKENWIGKPFQSIIDPKDRPLADDNYQMAQQGKARVFEARILCPNSECPVLSFSITPIVEHSEIVGSIGIGRDVAEQKKMEHEIIDLKNFNESIIESMEAGLLTMDLETHITSINAGGQKILGWKADEILGKPIRSVLKPEEVDALLSNPNRPGTPSYSRETQLTLKSGRSISIGFTLTDRIDNRRKKVGTIISFRDITQLKQMQAEVIRMDRLASLGVLASGLAHEIKNPLAGIKALAQACEEEFDSDDPRREYLIRISRQVNRLDDLLRTFFSFARPKTPDRKHHSISDILGEVLHLLSKKMHNQNIAYVQDLPEKLPHVWVDSQQMQQVFLNLMLNAIEAMPDGGMLKVNASSVEIPSMGMIRKNVRLADRMKASFIEASIQDTGAGIPPDQLETVFDPFFTTKPNGLGLGLSIVYRIIDEHRGDIQVESKMGIGTVFTITLPTGVTQ